MLTSIRPPLRTVYEFTAPIYHLVFLTAVLIAPVIALKPYADGSGAINML
jgi:hypothetical protein